MGESSERPQDQGRSHRKRRGDPSPETATLLGDYQAAMRAELTAVLVEIRGKESSNLLGELALERPSLRDRTAYWDLAIKLGRELGTSIDPGAGKDMPAATTPRPRRGKVDFG